MINPYLLLAVAAAYLLVSGGLYLIDPLAAILLTVSIAAYMLGALYFGSRRLRRPK